MKRLLLCLALVCSAPELAAATPVDISRPIEAQGAVRVDIKYGRLRIVGAEPGRIRVTGEVDDTLSGVSLGRDAGAVEVRVRAPLWSRVRGLWKGPSVDAVDLRIELPSDVRLFVVSRDADIEIEGIAGPIGVGVVSSTVVVRGEPERLDVEAVSGSLEFEGRTRLLHASTLSGDLRATGTEGSAQLEAVTGSLELLDARLRRATLKTVSGGVTVQGAVTADGLLEIETESGAVKLECRGPERAAIDLDTRDGEIINEAGAEKPIRDGRGHRVLKIGSQESGATARVRTRSGVIWLLPEGGI